MIMKKVIIYIVLLVISISMQANVSLPSIFASHMVMQQNSEVVIWGWGKPFEEIKITTSWDNLEYKTITDNQANWTIKIKTPKAGGPFNVTVKGYNTIVLEDVLIGEVWVCSGQSNMEWTARMGIDNADKEVAVANYPEIRFFSVVHRTALTPNYDVNGNWNVCTPETMIDFSAVAYFFARELQKELKVPVGLINTSWGGTPAEVWLPEEKVGSSRLLAESAAKLPEMGWCPREAGRVYNAMIAPITKFKIAGVLWYQGETNVANYETYYVLFKSLINSWRDAWDDDFPFYFAQIAPYTYGEGPIVGGALRNAQRKTLELEHTGMVVTGDITSDVSNIHPTNKIDVGKRFAHIALNENYGKSQFSVSGPLYRSNKIEGNKVTIFFDFADGLYSKTKKIDGFQLAGEDGVFVNADAKISGNTIIVTSKTIPNPVFVRYAYLNTAIPQIFNKSGLPASCFTTKEF